MAKKIQKKLTKSKRTSQMEKCIEEGKEFVEMSKKRAKAIALRKETPVIKGKRITKKAATKHFKSKGTGKKTAPKAPSFFAPSPPPMSNPSLPNKTSSKSSFTKKVIFKASSRDDLPMPAFGFLDVCFCLDATGSMSGELAQAKSTIESIINKISNKVQTEGITLRFGIVAYRDHPISSNIWITSHQDFTNADEAIKFANTLTAHGGGDYPEAVHDGLMDACKKMSWMNVSGAPMLRYIFHIADAPPHGKQFNQGATDGCLCGIKTDQVFHEINKRQIHYRMITVRSNLQQMQKVFKKGIMDYDCAEIAHASQMDVRIADMIIHEMLPE